MIKGIIFDFGGVLTNPGTFRPFVEECGEKFDIDPDELYIFMRKSWQAAKVSEIKSEVFWEKIAEYLNYDKEKLRRELIDSIDFSYDVLELVKSLKSNYKLALLSNHIEDWLGEEIKKHELEKVFDAIVTSYQEKMMKPDSEIYERTLDKLGLKGEECVFIDDKNVNIEAAEKLGIHGIVFQDLGQLRQKLKELGIEV